MDTRVILNLPRTQDLGHIPELAGAIETNPILTNTSPVRCTGAVSLIIPTFFNSELKQGSLRQLLSGVGASSAVAEIVLAPSDGEPRDFSELEVLTEGLPIKAVEAPPNHRARSRNLGAAAATQPYLLFVDDDMLLKSWTLVDVILSAMIEGNFNCALFPRRTYARFPLLYDRGCLEHTIRRWRAAETSPDPFFSDPLRDGTADLPMLFCFPGCFALMHKETFESLNGFNEDFLGWGFEDTDFALRAIRSFRTLNLFRKCEPLLHIDHPVSPYKSEEHRANSKKFFGSPAAVDVHRFCRSVFTGEDFTAGKETLLGPNIHLKPFETLRRRNIPLDLAEAAVWGGKLAESLMERFASPVPEFVILHGSRANVAGRVQSDYDVLFLYRGMVQDFFVGRSNPRVEIECASLHAFSLLAESPWLYDYRGALDLAKIAQGELLFGKEAHWLHWSAGVLQSAVKNGLCFWLLFGLGLRLNRAKHGPMPGRFIRSLNQMLSALRMPTYSIDDQKDSFGDSVETALHEQFPAWREMIARSEKLFELQVPEIWMALHWLADRKAKDHGPGI
jgi:hypothetical protein